MTDGEVGSLAQETAKLLRALAAERLSTGGAEHVCTTTWCPICQLVGYLHDHPELIEQVTETVSDAAVTVGRIVRDFLDTTLPPERAEP